MEYEVIRKKNFTKEYSKVCTSGNKKLRKKIDVVITNLQKKIFTSQMNSHSLSGQFNGWWDVHVEGNYIIVYQYNEEKHQLILLDMGTHDVVNTESIIDDITEQELVEYLQMV